jgi:hypothetical protein
MSEDAQGNPEYVTVPCFAAPRNNLTGPAGMADQHDDANAFDITTTAGETIYRYFACWIDINQPHQMFLPASPSAIVGGESIDGPWTSEWQQTPLPLQSIQTAISAAPHQCLVAEIRFDDTPIAAGATTGTSDKLAQRNIAWSDGPNPGVAASRRMPHPIQIRPTPKGTLNPDELMILWGNTPKASEAQLYLPALDAAEIVRLADRRYATHELRRIDAHTIACPARDATLIPLPTGTALAAGLLCVDLPPGIRKGETYIAVRQLTDATATLRPPPPPIQIAAVRDQATRATKLTRIAWREVLGGFQFAIAISTKEQLLLPEERLLAVLRWIAQEMPQRKRWYPVLLRYIDDVAGRVLGFGGDPTKILPSPTGQVQRAIDVQVVSWMKPLRCCEACGQRRRSRAATPSRTLYGDVRIASPRLHCCRCQSTNAPAPVSPLRALIPDHVAPERLYLEASWASLVPYAAAAELLADILPVASGANATTLRQHVLRVAERAEPELAEERSCFIDGFPVDWAELPIPEGRIVVGLDGGYVRDWQDRRTNFEVIVGQSVPEDRDARYVGLVHGYDCKPKRRLFDVLKSLGLQPIRMLPF